MWMYVVSKVYACERWNNCGPFSAKTLVSMWAFFLTEVQVPVSCNSWYHHWLSSSLFPPQASKAAAITGVQYSSDSDLGLQPDFSVGVTSTTPLQVTVTKTSLQLIKNLVDVRVGSYFTS